MYAICILTIEIQSFVTLNEIICNEALNKDLSITFDYITKKAY